MIQAETLSGPRLSPGRRWVCEVQPGQPIAQGGSELRADFDPRALEQRLLDHAVALGQAKERGNLLLAELALELVAEADLLEADRHLARDPQCAAKVEVALRPHHRVAERE